MLGHFLRPYIIFPLVQSPIKFTTRAILFCFIFSQYTLLCDVLVSRLVLLFGIRTMPDGEWEKKTTQFMTFRQLPFAFLNQIRVP